MNPLQTRLASLGYQTSDWTFDTKLLTFNVLIRGWKITIVANEYLFAAKTDEQMKTYIDACVDTLENEGIYANIHNHRDPRS